MTNDNDLLIRATDGDTTAAMELFTRQANGQALRLYPFGRKGPDDEGCAMIGISMMLDTQVPVIYTGTPRASTFGMPRKTIGKTIMALVLMTARSVQHHLDASGNEWEAAIEEHT